MSSPTTTEIMNAITALRQHVESKLATEIDGLRQHIESKLATEINGLRQHIDSKLETVNARLDGIDKRMDDHSRTLTALIPTRLAAVPSQDERRPS